MRTAWRAGRTAQSLALSNRGAVTYGRPRKYTVMFGNNQVVAQVSCSPQRDGTTCRCNCPFIRFSYRSNKPKISISVVII
jgi:hypothetical protein